MGLHKLPTLKLILQNVDSKGEGYIYLRVKVPGKKEPGKSPYIPKSLNHRVPQKYWDAENEIVTKGHPEAARINKLISGDKQRLQDEFDKDYEKQTIFTREHIQSRLYPQKSQKDFMNLFAEHLEFIKSQWSVEYGRVYEQGYETFKAFIKPKFGNSLPYHSVTIELLQSYQIALAKGEVITEDAQALGSRKPKPLQRNTIYLRMRHVREVSEKAVAMKLMDSSQLYGYKWPTYKSPQRPNLTLEQTEKIAERIYSGKFDFDPDMRATACYFLVECYAGIRISDWNKFEVEKLVESDRFKVGAATKNGKPIYLPLTEFKRLDTITRHIISNGIKFDISHQTANRLLKDIMHRCEIDVKVTTHIGRKTCATLLGEMGWNTKEVADVLAVSESTARLYMNTTRDGVKNAASRHGGL